LSKKFNGTNLNVLNSQNTYQSIKTKMISIAVLTLTSFAGIPQSGEVVIGLNSHKGRGQQSHFLASKKHQLCTAQHTLLQTPVLEKESGIAKSEYSN
jgi:hypothetical protein